MLKAAHLFKSVLNKVFSYKITWQVFNYNNLPLQLEDVDINIDDLEKQNAATKIQAGFRGHLARKQLKSREGKIYPWSSSSSDVVPTVY